MVREISMTAEVLIALKPYAHLIFDKYALAIFVKKRAYTMWKMVQTIGIFKEDDEIDIQEECFEDGTNPYISI